MTYDPHTDYGIDVPNAADLRAFIAHARADLLRELALTLGGPRWEAISRGELADYLTGRAEREEAPAAVHFLGGAASGLPCKTTAPHEVGHGCTFAASSAPQANDTEAVQA